MKLPRARDFRYIGLWVSPDGSIQISGGIQGGRGKYSATHVPSGITQRCDTYEEVREFVREMKETYGEGGVR